MKLSAIIVCITRAVLAQGSEIGHEETHSDTLFKSDDVFAERTPYTTEYWTRTGPAWTSTYMSNIKVPMPVTHTETHTWHSSDELVFGDDVESSSTAPPSSTTTVTSSVPSISIIPPTTSILSTEITPSSFSSSSPRLSTNQSSSIPPTSSPSPSSTVPVSYSTPYSSVDSTLIRPSSSFAFSSRSSMPLSSFVRSTSIPSSLVPPASIPHNPPRRLLYSSPCREVESSTVTIVNSTPTVLTMSGMRTTSFIPYTSIQTTVYSLCTPSSPVPSNPAVSSPPQPLFPTSPCSGVTRSTITNFSGTPTVLTISGSTTTSYVPVTYLETTVYSVCPTTSVETSVPSPSVYNNTTSVPGTTITQTLSISIFLTSTTSSDTIVSKPNIEISTSSFTSDNTRNYSSPPPPNVPALSSPPPSLMNSGNTPQNPFEALKIIALSLCIPLVL